MRITLVLIAFLLISCGQDAQVSRITGEWRTVGTGPTADLVEMTIDQDEKTISGIADVNSMVYDLDGRWEGSFGPDDVLELDISVTVGQSAIKGTGTLSTGAEEEDVTVAGTRTGRSFQMSVNSSAGETLEISGHLDYSLNDFRLTVDFDDIPAGLQKGESRNLQLNVSGTARGGGLELFRW
jgi:hypothetical protein